MTTSLANRQIKNQAVDAPKTDPTIIIAAGTNPFIGDQSLGLHKLIDLAMPTNPNDAASKAYVDSVSGGVTQMSITSDTNGLKFVNDVPLPGPTKYYGTNLDGTRGYYDLPVSTQEGEWLFSTNVAMVDPGTGKFRTNQVLFTTSTQMTIASVSSLGIDRTNVLKMLRTNDLILIQDKSNAVNWVRYRLTGDPTNNGTWYLMPIEMVEGGGTIPTNNSPTILSFAATSSSAGYTNEQAMDAAVSLFAAGAHIGIAYTYDDTGDALNSVVTGAPWSGIVGTPTTLLGYGITDAQPLDPDLTNLAGLIITGNALKVIRVNAAETGYELATVASGGGGTASAVTVSNNNALNAYIYPLWVTATGDVPLFVSTTQIKFRPADGYLTIAGVLTSVGVYSTGNITCPMLNALSTIQVGNTGTGVSGEIWFNGGTSGQIQVRAPLIAGSSKFVFPPTQGSSGQILQLTSGNGDTAWANPGIGVSDTTLPNNNVYPMWVTGAGNVSPRITTGKWTFNPTSGNMNLNATFTAISVNGTNQLVTGNPALNGLVQIYRNTGGSLIIQASPQSSGAYWMSLPPSAGLVGQVLQTKGESLGETQWVSVEGLATVASDVMNGTILVSLINGNMSVGLGPPSGLGLNAPVYIIFRDPSLASTAYQIVTTGEGPESIIYSGSTVGVPGPNVAFRLWVVAFNDAGTVRIGLVNLSTLALNAGGAYTLQFMRPLADHVLESSAISDSSAAADSAGTIYTYSVGVTSKPMRILGYLQWSGGLSTPGYWDVMPDIIQLYGAHVPVPGSIVQRSRWVVTVGASGTVTMPFDSTIPQDNEGNEFMVMSMGPRSSANILSVDATIILSHSAIATVSSALFRRMGVQTYPNARCTVAKTVSVAGHLIEQRLKHMELSQASNAVLTYSIRCGAAGAGTVYFNRTGALNNIHGGVLTSVMEIEEIMG